jgi:hypothetical protein
MSVCRFGKNPDTGAPTMPVIGQTNPNPLPVHGPLWFDAREFGVSPQNPDNGPALQAAHDAAAAALAAVTGGFFSGIPPTATIFIPGAKTPYTVKTPVFIEASEIEVRGERGATQLVTPSNCGYPIFYCGLHRAGAGKVPNATYRPDLWNGGSPKLDNTVVTSPGQRWGLRTNGDAFIVSQASVFSHGGPSPTVTIPDAWRETTQFTIEFAVEGFSGGQVPGGLNICGIGNDGYGAQTSAQAACPWFITTTGTNAFRLSVCTQPVRFGPFGGPYNFDISSGAATGVQRITIQVDCVAGTVIAFVNGTQVAATGSSLPANSTLNENHYMPFTVNSVGDGGGQSSGGDFALYGLCVSLSLRYANNGVGRPQVAHPQMSYGALTLPGSPTGGTWTYTYGGQTTAPISATATASQIQAALQSLSSIGAGNVTVANGNDTGGGINYQVTGANGFTLNYAVGQCNGSSLTGATIKDDYRYYPYPQNYPYNRDAYALGYLAFTENPATAPRHLAIQGGSVAGGVLTSALLLNNGSNDAIASDNCFTELVLNTSTYYGMSLALGHVINTTFDHLEARAGLYGAGNFPWGANYFHQIRNCTFSGNDCNYFAASSFVQMDNVTFATNNRCAIRAYASGIKAKHVIVGNYVTDPCAFAYMATGTYGGDYSFEDVTLDLEGGGALALALFYCEATAYSATTLKVVDVYGGNVGWVPIFKLKSMFGPPTWPAARLDAESIGADCIGGVVDVDGALWLGEVRNSLGDNGPYVSGSRATGKPRVVVVDDQSLTFPRFASWSAGTAKVKVPGPADGQYQELRVAADGTHGGATPPQWAGLNAIQANANASLAAYGIDHTSIAATLSGQVSSGGYLTIQGRLQLAQTLFGGTITGLSTTLTLYGTGLGGTFTLSYGGHATAPIAHNASAATVQAALQGLASVGAGNMSVGGNAGGPYTISLTGSLATTASGILGLTVNGAGLTSTGPTVTSNSGGTVFITFGGVTGGTFTLTGSGRTTSPIAWNATGSQVQAAVLAAGIPTSYGVAYTVPNAVPGLYYEVNANVTINASGLTGGGVASLAGNDLPNTWYLGLLTTDAHPLGLRYIEPTAGTTGYSRVAVANNTTNFGASSSGSKTSGTSITFPTATGAYTVQSIGIFPSATAQQAWAVIQLASPLAVSAGTTPTISSGGLTFNHVPYTGHFSGSMTDLAWGKVYDLLFGGVALTPPTTWYAALSTAAVSRTTTSLTEPPGGGYARKAITNSSASWLVGGSNDVYSQPGDARNAAAVVFPAPTGNWGSIVATALTDSATGGNAWFVAPLTAPFAPAAGTPAPTFASGALTLATG